MDQTKNKISIARFYGEGQAFDNVSFICNVDIIFFLCLNFLNI
jgi:hypothetical protein